MDPGVAMILWVMRYRVFELARNVLNERSPKSNIHDLNAATDGERRHPPFLRFENERNLALVAPGVRLDASVGLLAIALRRNILASGDDEASDAIEDAFRRRRRQGRNDQGDETDPG